MSTKNNKGATTRDQTFVTFDKNKVPIPAERRGRPLMYRWNELKVGRSMLIAPVITQPRKRAVRTAAMNYAQRHGYVFRVRVVDKGIRVWRIS